MHFLLQVLTFVGKIVVSGVYCFIYVFFTELIPTVVRNMGLGIASKAARIGTVIYPCVIYMGKCILVLSGLFVVVFKPSTLRVRMEGHQKYKNTLE